MDFRAGKVTDPNPLLHRALLRLPVDEEKHQADDDERLDEGREEEYDLQVVAAALPFVSWLPGVQA